MRAPSVWILACLACESGGAAPRERPAPLPEEFPIEQQARRLVAASAPTSMHERLRSLVGEWEVDLAGASAGKTFAGRAVIAPVLGGRFLRWELRVDFGPAAGTSLWLLGYAKEAARYELAMMSDLGTSIALAAGTGDPSGEGLVFLWDREDPRAGGRSRARARLRILGPDRFVLEQLEAQPGARSERPALVWTYRRASSSAPGVLSR